MRFAAAAAVLATAVMATDYAPPGGYAPPPGGYAPPPAVSSSTTEAYSAPATTEAYSAPPTTEAYSAPATTEAYSAPVTSATEAVSTVYSTRIHTITSCAATVTNCPAHSTVISTEYISISTTICPVTETEVTSTWAPTGTPSGYAPPPPYTSVPYVTPSSGGGGYAPPPPVSTWSPVTSVAPPVCQPSSTVKAITKSYTTVLTSVEYSTIEVPCPTSTPAGYAPPPPYTSAPAGGNGTYLPPPSAGAASFTGSALFAAVAGLVAVALA